ncbi:E3 ubiquitin-protein ligase pub23 [Phtheirospermum japonicum]|uniref:U-box domain-containing protein n=1 Tax=Phtheirospermum japonicum TaxID=374723 RepID=A0A830BBT5_9LAMI|nr:E3 ubiquitin-protein ligase pub23 [Phtheirospermum japonicum]
MAEIEIPPYFICPITLEIMKDPVTIPTGITYDRDSIEKWIFIQKTLNCPVTKQTLDPNQELITPNIILRRLIQSWCTLHAPQGIQRLPTPKAHVSKSQLLKILDEAKKSNPQTQMKCLQSIRSIASQNQTNKRCMESAGVPGFLSDLIVQKTREASRSETSEDLSDLRKACDEALSILCSLQLSESGLKALNNAEFVESLTLIMQFGNYESRAYATMLLKSMLEVADPSLLINLRPEFFAEFRQTLDDQISHKATKGTLKALIAACPWGRNRIKAVEAGMVPVLIDLLLDSFDKRVCEMMLVVLDLLCQCAEGRAELLKHGAGLAVVSKKILRVSQVASEKAVRILSSVSRFCANPGVLHEMLQIGVVAKLCLVVQVDCGSKTKERAREMLNLHSRAWRNSPCIPRNLISSYPS